MSEKLFRFLASEINRIRILCKRNDCGTVIEFDVKQLSEKKDAIHCPRCGNALQKGPDKTLAQFAGMLDEFAKLGFLDVEFLLPDKSQ